MFCFHFFKEGKKKIANLLFFIKGCCVAFIMLSWVVLVAITTTTKPRQGGLNSKYLFLTKLDARGLFPAGCGAELLGGILFWCGISVCSVFTGERGVGTEKENLCSLLSIGTRFLSEGSALIVQPSFPDLACTPHCIGD